MPSKLILETVYTDLVEGINQADIARKYNRTKGSVSQASKIVWRGFLKSKGYQEVRVVLPEVRAFIANGWHNNAFQELKHGTKRPERGVRRPRRPSREAERQLDQ